MYLSVIIPAYNEEKRIGKTLAQINDYLMGQHFDYEIIVVSDGSDDKTVQVVNNLKLKIKHLGIMSNEKNRGKGFVVRQGLLNAHGDLRLFTDADNATDIRQLEKFLPHIFNYDIIVGSRVIDGSKIIKSQPLYRRILGNIYRPIIRIVVGKTDVHDTQCGFKLFKAESAKKIIPLCRINGFSFDAEMLIIAKKLGHRIKEIPILWKNDPNTKLGIGGMINAILELFLIKLHFILGDYNKQP